MIMIIGYNKGILDGDGMMFERSTREAKRSAKRDETTFRDEHPFKKNKR